MSQQINLFTPIFLKKKKYFSAVAMAVSITVMLLGALLIYAVAHHQVTKLEKQVAAADKRVAADEARLSALISTFTPKQPSKALEDEIKRTETFMESRRRVSEGLNKGGLGDTQGFSGYMRAFARQHVEGIWLTSFKISGGRTGLTLKGRTLDAELVPVYIQRLQQEPIMRGNAFSAIEMHSGSESTGDDKSELAFIEFELTTGAMDEQKPK